MYRGEGVRKGCWAKKEGQVNGRGRGDSTRWIGRKEVIQGGFYARVASFVFFFGGPADSSSSASCSNWWYWAA